ncbi:MAG TPA: OsmC family protein [Actinomycetota bacterium]|nr:OsmC family protein [Actinomycetota bacterium]
MSQIKEAMQNASAYLGEHPEEARYTDSLATATLESGLRCAVTGPNGERVETDMPASVGGESSGPSAGWLLRAAIASCNATVIAMRAAQQGISLTRLEVDVDSESDDRGILGLDPGIPAGPFSIRVQVRIAGEGDDARLREIAEWGVEHCPVCDAAKRAIPVSLEIETG